MSRGNRPAGRAAQPPGSVLERHNVRTRWFHAGVYLTVLVLLGTGWWLTLGQEGRPSVLAELVDQPDTEIHLWVGWGFVAVAAAGVLLGWRAAWTVLADSVRFRRTDLRWFARWPLAVLTGRFGRHDGHFDPGQRIANLALVGLLLALTISGIGLWAVSGGPVFVWYNRVHRWSTYLVTPVILGHIVIASGLLPGYRGAWRAMHLGGRLRRATAQRLWPGWLERHEERAGRAERPERSGSR